MGRLSDIFEDYSALKKICSALKNFFNELKKLDKKQRAKKITGLALLLLVIISVLLVGAQLFGVFTPSITQVTLSNYSLSMNTGDTGQLSATVLYCDNTKDFKVLWVSSNEAVVQIDENGRLSALAEGSSVITAQASNRKSTGLAECVVTVSDPIGGYSISVQRTVVDNYVYIYVQPEDDGVFQITLYAKSPSGEIYTPPIDENSLYRFYSETGTWTVYASLKGQNGTYEAHKPEDFVTVEINKISDGLLTGLQ